MKCRKIQKLLSDGELSDAQQQAVEQHLQRCSGCRQVKAQLDVLVSEFVPLLPVPDPRHGFAGRTLARIPEDQSQASWLDQLMEFLQPTPAALATASLALGIFLAVSMNGAAREAQSTNMQGTLFAEFFDITPFDSMSEDASPASVETEH